MPGSEGGGGHGESADMNIGREKADDACSQRDPEKDLEDLEKPIHTVPAAGRTPQGFRADPRPAVRAKPSFRLRGYKFLPALLAFESFSQVFIRDFILGFALPAFASHFSGSFLVLLPHHGED